MVEIKGEVMEMGTIVKKIGMMEMSPKKKRKIDLGKA